MKTHPSNLRQILALISRTCVLLLALAITAITFFFAGCASPSAPSARSPGRYESGFHPQADAAPAKSRPGLGTGWGEERDSQTRRTDFVRADGNRPAAVDRIYYDDREGIEAMLAHEGGSDRRAKGLARMAEGLISVGIKTGSG